LKPTTHYASITAPPKRERDMQDIEERMTRERERIYELKKDKSRFPNCYNKLYK